jgi:hypothetical protein
MRYRGSIGTVRIPATIQGLPVRELNGDGSVLDRGPFYENTIITSVVIPEGIIRIPRYAFMGCENLSSITLPSTITSIGMWAFRNCSALTSITLPAGLTEISGGILSVTGLTSFPNPWPAAITTIPQEMFRSTRLHTVVIPEGITRIEREAFANIPTLNSITFPSTLTFIHNSAFSGSRNIDLASQQRIRQINPNVTF